MTVGPLIDVLIIGGGPAGLSTAMGLARQMYTAVVFDSGKYRDALVNHMHNVLTWDHAIPANFREKGRKDILRRYNTIDFENVEIKAVHQNMAGQFEALDANGKTWLGKKLVLATGVSDIMPDIKGYEKCWAKGIFHCLFCHGYEQRNVQSAGILAVGDVGSPYSAQHLARMARRLTPNITIYTDGSEDLAKQIKDILIDDDIKLESQRITLLEKETDTLVNVFLEDGTKVTEGFLVHKPKSQINGPFARELALELTAEGDIKTTGMFYESSVTGIFAVGDCATSMKAVSQAVAMGSFSAAGLVSQLQVPEPKPKVGTEDAVEYYQT